MLKLMKQLIRLHHIRHHSRIERKKDGRCGSCGGKKKCEQWCWGPHLYTFLWFSIRSVMKPRLVIFYWYLYSENLEWAGVEPWHRY